jgi:hypothetical protein
MGRRLLEKARSRVVSRDDLAFLTSIAERFIAQSHGWPANMNFRSTSRPRFILEYGIRLSNSN